jgi:Ser/Thr protein kinase RdoA (MazF antagonist)
MPRTVTLVFVDPSEKPIGALAPFEVATPWWPHAAPVVASARDLHGVEVTVLRLIDARPDPTDRFGAGGSVTYAVETAVPPADLRPWRGSITEDPKRAAWARPGGPASDLNWADAVLLSLGRRRLGPAEQIKTWNLSSVWRLPTREGDAWLKVVPPFAAHEGAVIAAIGPPFAPVLLGTEPGRVLLRDVPGEDRFDAPLDLMLEMVGFLVKLQTTWMDRLPELLSLGLPDWRLDKLGPAIARLVARCGNELGLEERRALDRLILGLPDRWTKIESCGLPATLVHGDFHPGNFRGEAGNLVLMDWGDSFIGHPLFDTTAMLEGAGDRKQRVREGWVRAWAEAVPGSEPARAAELLAPVAALRNALVYQSFLDQIEASEHSYHAADVPRWLAAACREPVHEDRWTPMPDE